MFSAPQIELLEQVTRARGIPKLVLPPTDLELPKDSHPCGRCGTLIHQKDVLHYQTGLLIASDFICKECLKLVHDHAVVICVVCRKAVTRIPPYKDKTGFIFESRKIYHTDACPACQPGLVKSTLIEKALFDRAIK